MSVRGCFLGCALVAITSLIATNASAQYFLGGTAAYDDGASWLDGAVPNGGTAYIGSASYPSGVATLNHDVTSLASSYLYLGYDANTTGELDLSDGANLSITGMRLAYDINGLTGGTGTLSVAGGTLTDSGAMSIGYYGTGIYNQTGGSVSTAYYNVGVNGIGSATISGDSSTLTVNNNVYVGMSAGSTGTVVQNGGLVHQGGTVAGFSVGSEGNGSYTVNGGTVVIDGQLGLAMSAGVSGTITQTGGLVEASAMAEQIANDGGTVYGTLLGQSGTGTYSLSGGTFKIDASMFVGNNENSSGHIIQTGGTLLGPQSGYTIDLGQSGDGTYDLSDGVAKLGTIALGIGGTSTGTINQTGGTVQTWWNDYGFWIGYGATGAYNLSGGTVNAPYTLIGGSAGGNGAVHQTGGVWNQQNELYIGYAASSTGVYTLDSGTFAGTAVYVGIEGTGTFNQNGGAASVTGEIAGYGTYNLAGGTMNMNGQNVSVATFNFTGGTLQNIGAVSTGVSLGTSPVFQQDAGTTGAVTGALSDVSGVAGTLTKTGGGTLVLSGA
ncbi:MAG: hypothetical protein ABFC96_05320, partial [Thermoguttaceae bacterium]